jgi:GAF domain-containing protein
MASPRSGVEGGPDVVRMLDEFDGVSRFLGAVVRWAVARTPGAEACGLTVEQAGHGVTVEYSGEMAARADERQYELDDGPCLEAMRTGEAVLAADMSIEERWGAYPQRAVEVGVGSSLSLPLRIGNRGRGALNLYSTRTRAFTDEDRRAAESWAGQAGGALAVALRMAEREAAVDHLQHGMVSRQVIGQAVGLLMAQRRCGADEAFELLKGASQRSNEKLRDIAQRLVDAHEAEVRTAPTISPTAAGPRAARRG